MAVLKSFKTERNKKIRKPSKDEKEWNENMAVIIYLPKNCLV